MLWLPEDFPRLTRLDNESILHDLESRCHFTYHAQIVCDEQDGQALFLL